MARDRSDLGMEGPGAGRGKGLRYRGEPKTLRGRAPSGHPVFGDARKALTCRTFRRLDSWRPLARAAPRRSTLLSGRLPAGAWQLREKLRLSLFPHCFPLRGGELLPLSCTFLSISFITAPASVGLSRKTSNPKPLQLPWPVLTQPWEGADCGGRSR